jgi:hypothetical protein
MACTPASDEATLNRRELAHSWNGGHILDPSSNTRSTAWAVWRMKRNECNLIAFGFVLGVVTAGTYAAALHLDSKWFLGTDERLQWETLVTGIGAVVAAFFTVRRLQEQITQTQKLADDQRQRLARAARATLPLALSQLAQYATSCIKGLYDLRPYFRTHSADDLAQRAQKCAVWELPLLSDNVFNSLKECVEVIDDEPAQAIVALIGHIQIQRSRLEGYISRARLNDPTHLVAFSNIEHAMYDAAEIHARTSTLFPFSRGYPPQAPWPSHTNVYMKRCHFPAVSMITTTSLR